MSFTYLKTQLRSTGGSSPTYSIGGMGFSVASSPWTDLTIPLVGLSQPSTGLSLPTMTKLADDGAGSGGVFAWAFPHNSDRDLLFSGQLPHDLAEGSSVKLHIHYTILTNNSGAIKWSVELWQANIGDAFGSTHIYSANTTIPASSLGKHLILDLGEISASGSTISKVFVGRLYRDNTVASNIAESIPALSVDFHYQTDSNGSILETDKDGA